MFSKLNCHYEDGAVGTARWTCAFEGGADKSIAPVESSSATERTERPRASEA